MFKWLNDRLFPIMHRRIKAKYRQERKLAEFKRRSVASKDGWDRRNRVIDRRAQRFWI